MMNKVEASLNNLFNELDKDESVKQIKVLSKSINNDKNLLSLIQKYNELSLNNHSNQDLIDIKNKLFSNIQYKKYTTSKNNLSYFIMYFNKQLSNIIDIKQCFKH